MGRLQYGAGKRKTHFREQLRRRTVHRPSASVDRAKNWDKAPETKETAKQRKWHGTREKNEKVVAPVTCGDLKVKLIAAKLDIVTRSS